MLDLAKDMDERRTVLKSKAATVATELANVPKPPADAVLIPCLPGSIIHSNHIKPEVMLQAAMNGQGLLATGGFTTAQIALFTKWSLTHINQMSLLVPESQTVPVSSDLQTTQGKEDAKAADAAKATDPAKRDVGHMEAQAELKRKSEDTDDDWTDASECSDKKDLNEVQQAETGDKPNERSRVRRREKKGMKEKNQGSKSGNKGK